MLEVYYQYNITFILIIIYINVIIYFVSVPPRYDPVFRLSPPPSMNTFPCLIDPTEGAFEAFDIIPK